MVLNMRNSKPLGPFDRKFHGHVENDEVVQCMNILFNNAVVFANI